MHFQPTNHSQWYAHQRDDDDESNYDHLSDMHNLIIGSIVLLLTLAGLIIAYLTLRQARQSQVSHRCATPASESSQVELGDLGGYLFAIQLESLSDLSNL